MSPWREQCAWCNHGNTVTETGEGTERMLSYESVLAGKGGKKITLNQLNEQNKWDKFILWETSLELFHAACVNLQYRTCRDEEDNVSVCSLLTPLCFSKILQRFPYMDLVVLRKCSTKYMTLQVCSFCLNTLCFKTWRLKNICSLNSSYNRIMTKNN